MKVDSNSLYLTISLSYCISIKYILGFEKPDIILSNLLMGGNKKAVMVLALPLIVKDWLLEIVSQSFIL